MQTRETDSDPILELSFELSSMIIDYREKLGKKRRHIIHRLLGAGSNAFEDQAGEHKADFARKLKTATKEAGAIQYRFRYCLRGNDCPVYIVLPPVPAGTSQIVNRTEAMGWNIGAPRKLPNTIKQSD